MPWISADIEQRKNETLHKRNCSLRISCVLFFFLLIIQIVGHVISPNGIAYSGGPSLTGAVAPGHHMEITVLQLYKVALSAGKAHRDHKHHHAHHFDHDGLVTTTPQPTQAPQVLS